MQQSRGNSDFRSRLYTTDQNVEELKTPPKVRDARNFTFFGVTKGIIHDAPISIAFKIILQNGEQHIFQYHEVVSPMVFNGSSKIVLNTSSLSITIEGKKLNLILDYLSEHRLMWLKEPDSEFMQTKYEWESEIDKIMIEERL
ncbi:MAG: hypothetical protein AAGG68_25320 [Bacteroidota bacterium]